MDERARVKREPMKGMNDSKGATSGVIPQSVLRSESSDSQPPVSIAPGVVLDSKYLVGRIIGEGAFGIVFEAKNLELDEKVALKVMRPEAATDKALVARFAREAKAAAAIKSENVASVYDVGSTKNGPPFIVMEYLEGKDLGTIVEQQGPLPARLAVEYALQICEALAVAHSKGIVHRDIKPENLLLTERAGGMRIVKVLDFGISKAALTGSIFGSDIPIVKTVNLVGTPLYMSPEQVRCTDNVDVRSDIWSLGMVLYEILAGATAFEGASITEICASIIENPPKPIEIFRNDLPAGLVDVVYRCLEKDATKRFQNVAELAAALMPFGPKRSRLNVERAVAVLKASGHVHASFEVDSAFPPSSDNARESERFLRDSMNGLRSSSVPNVATASGASQTLDSPSKPPVVATGFSVHEAPTAKTRTVPEVDAVSVSAAPIATASTPPETTKSRPTALILGIVAIVSVVAGAAFVLRPMLANRAAATANAAPAPPPPATTTATPPTTAAITAAPPTATTPHEPAPAANAAPGATGQPTATTATKAASPAVAPVKAPLSGGAVARPKTTPAAPNTASSTAPPPPATTAGPTAPTPAETSTGRTFRRGL